MSGSDDDDDGAGARCGRWRRPLALGGLALGGAAAAGLAWAHHHDLPPAELEPEYAEGEDDFLDVDGLRVHYRDEGPRDAPVLLCLHGTFSSLHTWDGWVDALAGEYRVVRPDLPGHGLTGPHPEDDYSMAAYVAFVEAFRERLDIDEWVVAGNSRGGEIAWRYALDHPERTPALVLVDSMGFPMAFESPFGIIELPWLPNAIARLTPRRLVRRSVRDVYGDPSRVSEELVDRYHDLVRREGNRDAGVELVRRDVNATHRHEELADLGTPTLVLWGEEDYLIPPWFGEDFAEAIPDAELVTYEDAGHTPMEEIPERTAADVRRFLDGRLGE
ncbi:alpha/beta fold hydrolase [Haloglomus litoreum]|uniref:alpha/beta fold hydrolase n=1 Tax=Haloglomus litoreum TaxID=3034026 RepID=UPI0023E89831|nr:alpha/beta hydrolase [Haloglomus sp. DT116]